MKSERRTDLFAVVTLIVTTMVIVFLIFCAVYFFMFLNGTPPSHTQASFAAWVSIIAIILLFALMVYALARTVKGNKAPVPEEKTQLTEKLSTVTKTKPKLAGKAQLVIADDTASKITPATIINVREGDRATRLLNLERVSDQIDSEQLQKIEAAEHRFAD